RKTNVNNKSKRARRIKNALRAARGKPVLEWPKVNASLCAHGIILVLVLLFFLLSQPMPLVSTVGFEAANLFVLFFAPALGLASVLYQTPKGTLNFRQVFFHESLWA